MTKRLRRLLSIPYAEATFERRGFRQTRPEAVSRLEEVGRAFLRGYHTALAYDSGGEIADDLNREDEELRGFAFEGAAMGLELLDGLFPRGGTRLRRFLAEEGGRHTYMIHVGAGWALARVPWLRYRTRGVLAKFDPVLRWLVIDGFGFHEGYFKPRRSVDARKRPRLLSGYELRAFDQGLGRSLWFSGGADVGNIASAVASFEQPRQKDLWGGIGLASAYAGGAGAAEFKRLRAAADAYLPYAAQGAAFAAKARQSAGFVPEHTEVVCEILCGATAAAAAGLADVTRKNLPQDRPCPAYEVWRRRIQAAYSTEVELA